MNSKKMFTDFISETNLQGSNKASSYIRALDLLGEMLIIDAKSFRGERDLWQITETSLLDDLSDLTKQEQSKGSESVWLSTGIAPSYLVNGYCSAALKSYRHFLTVVNHESHLMKIFAQHGDDGLTLAKKFYAEPDKLGLLIDDLTANSQGKDVIRSIKTRVNQSLFRRMVLSIYNNSCCITGLNISELNRASHIIPWAENATTRLDPSNGLCLSATYDAAFDRHLITLDNDYRIVLSKTLKEQTKEQTKEQSVTDYFYRKEGLKIKLPLKFLPSKAYLEMHRSRCDL